MLFNDESENLEADRNCLGFLNPLHFVEGQHIFLIIIYRLIILAPTLPTCQMLSCPYLEPCIISYGISFLLCIKRNIAFCRMASKNVGNFAVAMVICVAVGFLSYLLCMFLPALTKEITSFCFCRLANYLFLH